MLNIVQTTEGMARGMQLGGKHEGLTMFRGIPYAAPPVGEMRWRPPVRPQPWDGIRTFDHYAPIEVQFQSQYADGNPDEVMSEDCLYLNITTPAETGDEKLPVFVWFHGGGLTNGASYHDEGWEPYALAKKGNVVVSIGHRLNIWGFMALPQLSAEQGGKSGNYGIMDLVMAMDWITENIGAFGGDPEKITAGGASGGTQKTCLMASIPAGKNRIRRIYNSSGLKWLQLPFLTIKEAEEAGRKYLEYIGVDPDTPIEVLRAMKSEQIHAPVPRSVYPGDIIFDGELVPLPSMRQLFDRYLSDVDFLNISAQGEANIFASHGSSGAYGSFTGEVPVTDADSFYAFFRERLGNLYEQYDFSSLVSVTDEDALYQAKLLGAVGLSPLASNNHSRNNMVNRLFGEYMKHKHPHSRVFTLLWSHIPPYAERGYGTDTDPACRMASHCEDVLYVCHSLHQKKSAAWSNADYEIADLMGSYLDHFIKTGDVNAPDLPVWPETKDMHYLEMQDEPAAHTDSLTQLEKMVRDYVIREYAVTAVSGDVQQEE